MGFPLVTASREGESNSITLIQEKFNADGSSEPGYHWKVPINILTQKGKVHKVLLEDKSMTVTLDDLDKGEWYKVNADFTGYYRQVVHILLLTLTPVFFFNRIF